MIENNEIQIARRCIGIALQNGAHAARVSLNKSMSDTVSVLNGEIDKVTHSADRSLYFYIFADGKYGTFSTNMLDIEELEKFIIQAIDMVKMLGEDPLRTLPESSRTENHPIPRVSQRR